MVSTLSIIFMFVTLLICFGFPVLLFVLANRKAKKLYTALLAGSVGFFVMQIMIRIPLLGVLSEYTNLSSINVIMYTLILGSTAALFETFARIISVKLFMKEDYRFYSGVSHGIGHGGIEAIMLIGFAYIANIVYAYMINKGTFESLLTINSSYQILYDTLIETSPSMYLIGGVERIFTILFHISLSVLVFYGFKTNNRKMFYLVFVLHMFLDSSAILLVNFEVNIILIELYILLFTGIMMYVTYNVYTKYRLLLKEGENDV